MNSKQREELYETLFGAELALSGAAKYLQHLHKITQERAYIDALVLVCESITDLDVQRQKLRADSAVAQ